MKKNSTEIEIPFGAKDSELYQFTYTIPDGYSAEIKDGKVIVKKKESEDERIRKAIIRLLQNGGYMEPQDKEKAFAYLEKQKEQKPTEWSEEDENRFRNLIYLVERSDEGKGTKEGFVKFINRLKSLRSQPHWKPSNEQMEILGRFNDPILKSLHNDLKKL